MSPFIETTYWLCGVCIGQSEVTGITQEEGSALYIFPPKLRINVSLTLLILCHHKSAPFILDWWCIFKINGKYLRFQRFPSLNTCSKDRQVQTLEKRQFPFGKQMLEVPLQPLYDLSLFSIINWTPNMFQMLCYEWNDKIKVNDKKHAS